MKFRKRAAALLMAVGVAVCAAACGETEKEAAAEKEAGEMSGDEVPAAEDAWEKKRKIPYEDMETENTSADRLGVLTETTYESAWMGIRFTLPDGYVMATAEESGALMEAGLDAVSEKKEQLLKGSVERTSTEVMALQMDGSGSILIAVEKLMFSNMTEEQYLQGLKSSMGYLSEDFTYEFSDEAAFREIAGAEYKGITMYVYYMGTGVDEEVWVRKKDGQMIVITVPCQDGEEKEEAFWDYFEPYDGQE